MKNRDYLKEIAEVLATITLIIGVVTYMYGDIDKTHTFYLIAIICKLISISRDLDLKK
jgi:hypothetical protein